MVYVSVSWLLAARYCSCRVNEYKYVLRLTVWTDLVPGFCQILTVALLEIGRSRVQLPVQVDA